MPSISIRELVMTFYYKGGELFREKRLNRDLKLYDRPTIEKVQQRYKAADDVLNKAKMILADQLFTASLSGHTEAKSAFLQFHTCYPELSGVYLHQYRILSEMLSAWEKADETLYIAVASC